MSRKQRILVIDDDPSLVKMIGLILHRAGYEVAAAESGVEGLNKLTELKPDLVILDRMMPLMDGLEVVRRIRANPATAQLPIMMLSALGRVDDKVDGFQAGVDDYVAKPVEPKELMARTRALLIRSQYSRPPAAKTVAIVGAKGGVGTTSVALNLAMALAKQEKAVALVELKGYGGDVRYHLKLKGGQDLGPLLELDASQIKRPEIERRLIHHSSGLHLLLAPQYGGERRLTVGHIEAVLDVLTSRMSYVILDVPPLVGNGIRRALELSDQILLVTEPETLSVTCALDQVERMKEWGVFDRLNVVIVSRGPSASWLNRVEVENRLGMGGGEAQAAARWEPRALEVGVRLRQGVAGVIPPGPELFHESVRNGVPIILIEPSAPAARALFDLAEWLVEGDQPAPKKETESVKYIIT
ncbi:MAG: response regulator [Chloroflexi bacterium]|nr:response regulator [Chloroflexota bacterium]MCI0580634.1 response regulator [Chloroflexota bacterium]MCI0647646.1 response regulator [Chloroflexota bacterium]MCI0731138.1 response regulator [Chloroflexota bacterium]